MTRHLYILYFLSPLLIISSANATRESQVGGFVRNNMTLCPACQDIPGIDRPAAAVKGRQAIELKPCLMANPPSPLKVEIKFNHDRLTVNDEEYVVIPLAEYNKLHEAQQGAQ